MRRIFIGERRGVYTVHMRRIYFPPQKTDGAQKNLVF